ncbi:MAG: S24 family peptidase [Photobacterium frigidiphilum]|uniref:S24 family peptidase n=1 Tax=Photobacterium frigidiphilum TaxID=264736 RepID=UPI003001427C
MLTLPIFMESVKCGFPSPADGYQEQLELDEYLIRNPNATFLLRASGESMIGAGIYDVKFTLYGIVGMWHKKTEKYEGK